MNPRRNSWRGSSPPMPNALATTLITTGIVLTVIGTILGQLNLGDLGLLSFALLIALNCQKWEEGMK